MTTLEPVSVALKFGFLAVLYLFLLWVARSALRDLRGRGTAAGGVAAPPAPDATGLYSASTLGPVDVAGRAPRLVVERAPGHESEMIYNLDGDLVLGRGERAEIRLEDPFASARHARIYRQAGTLVLEDLHSTNGTYLNEELLDTPARCTPAIICASGRANLISGRLTRALMLRVSEHYAATDTGRQRRANEDSLLARSPLFVVADGMGGAQAGEVALADRRGVLPEWPRGRGQSAGQPRPCTPSRPTLANEPSQSNAEQAGMGNPPSPPCTPRRAGGRDRPRRGQPRLLPARRRAAALDRRPLPLVDELDPRGPPDTRGSRGAPAAFDHHPRPGARKTVEVDTRSFKARSGDSFLLCSDGLTSMVPEARLAELLRTHRRLRDAGEALIAEANAAGGRDNITVILLRLEAVELEPPDLQAPADPARTDPPRTRPHQTVGGSSAAAVVSPRPVDRRAVAESSVVPGRPRAPSTQPALETRGPLRRLIPALTRPDRGGCCCRGPTWPPSRCISSAPTAAVW
jgi:hypothetical protein